MSKVLSSNVLMTVFPQSRFSVMKSMMLFKAVMVVLPGRKLCCTSKLKLICFKKSISLVNIRTFEKGGAREIGLKLLVSFATFFMKWVDF